MGDGGFLEIPRPPFPKTECRKGLDRYEKIIWGFLKPYTGQVLLVICVLIIQAYCDLSLPSYTSDIVNVGIQQSGIDERVPEALAEEDLGVLLMLAKEEDRAEIADAYQKSDESYDYDGTVMVLKEEIKENEDEMEKLVEKLELPMVMAMMLEETNAGAAAREKVMESLPETMTEQTAAAYIRSAYEKIGLDLDKISSSYILVTGGKMLALAGAGMAASILVGLIASLVGAGLGRNLRKDVFRKVVGFSNGEFDQFSTASLITRSTNDIQQIQLLTVMILRMVLYAPILAVGGVWNVFHTNVDMSWIIALAVALIFLLVAVLFAVVMPRFRILQNIIDFLPVGTVYQILLPIGLVMGIGIGFLGSFFTVRKHLKV